MAIGCTRGRWRSWTWRWSEAGAAASAPWWRTWSSPSWPARRPASDWARWEVELARMAILVAEHVPLRRALTDPALPDERKRALVEELLAGRTQPETVALVGHVARGHEEPAGRWTDWPSARPSDGGAWWSRATTAVPLTDEQERRLTAALARATGRQVDLEVVVDPSVVGGVVARVGDEIIDGSVRSQLRSALEQLTA